MVMIEGLDIPGGLEEAFFKILNWGSLELQTVLRLGKKPTARYSLPKLSNRSLMVAFQSTYDGLSSAQKIAWEDYWGGWPGSGYSAFIQVNAPLYRAGDDLLLDPPGGNKIYNGDFALGFDGWDATGFYFDSGKARVDPSGDSQYIFTDSSHLFKLTAGNQYEVSADIDGGGDVLNFTVYDYDSSRVVKSQDYTDVSDTVVFDFTSSRSGPHMALQVYANAGWSGTVDNLQLYKI